MVQHLVEGTTSTSGIMPTVTLVHTQTLAPPTQYQVQYRTGKQAWLGLTGSHLMRWKCFISAESHDVETRQLLEYQLFSFIKFLYVAVLNSL